MSEPRDSSNSGFTVANPELVMDVKEANAKYLLPAEPQIPKGYKQTEVGVIPEDWRTRTLRSLTNLMTNGFVGTATSHYASNDNGILYIQGYNVEENSFNFHGVKFVTEEFHKAHQKSCLRGGDLLTVQTGDVGLTTIVPDSLTGANCHALIISRFDKKEVSPFFISYYLNSNPGRARLRLIETGTTMKHLNVGDMLEFLVPLPPTTAEQEAIAEALSDTDALIEALEQLIAKKRQLKQGAMQELLTGKRRLSGFSGDWEIKQLGELAHIKTGSRNNEDKIEDGEYPFFVRSENIERINSYSHDCEAILVPGEGRIGEIFHYIKGQFDVHQRVYAITQFKASVSAKFVHLYMAMNFGAWAMQNTVKATVDSLRLPTFVTFEMRLPPTKAEQTAIAQILTDMDAEITELESKLAKARAVKQGMMQQLLTGKIRLI